MSIGARTKAAMRSVVGRYLTAFVYVAATTLIAEALDKVFDTSRLSTMFLGSVLLAAVTLGRGPALFAALLSFLFYNFYLVEPRYTIQFGSPEDYFVLASFLAVGLLTGGLAGRLRDENEASTARARRMAALFEATREMSAVEAQAVLSERLAVRLSEAVGGPAWVLAETTAEPAAWTTLNPADAAQLRSLCAAGGEAWLGAETLAEGPWRLRALAADGRRLGLALWRAPGGPTGPEAEHLARVLIEVGAGALARARLGAEKAEIETVARTERLRTALLSSISHDFRTPLAAILASATSLIEFDDSFDAPTRQDLLATIQEEAERLNRFVANLLNMTRLESGALELKIVPVPLQEVGARAVDRLRRLIGARRVVHSGSGAPLMVDADPVLLEQVLINLVENAVTFSPDGSEIALRVADVGRFVELEISDQGTGVSPADLKRIFDKFYRASNDRQATQGAGLGLSICRGLVEAMAGTVEALPRADGGAGLSVVVRLPKAAAHG